MVHYKIHNHTNVKRSKLKELLKFCTPKELIKNKIKVDVLFVHGSNFRRYVNYNMYEDKQSTMSGLCCNLYSLHSKYTPLVIIKIDKKFTSQFYIRRRKKEQRRGYCIDYQIFSRSEDIISILAHELYHIKQHIVDKSKKDTKRESMVSERNAEIFGTYKISEWRLWYLK